MKKLKIMLVAKRDNGLGRDMAKALNMVGCDAKLYLQYEHNDLREAAQKADVIQFLHSDYVNLGISLQRKACVVLHSGMAYRKNPERINDVFNPITRLTLIQTADLLGLGATNEFYWPGMVDTDEIEFVNWRHEYHKISHIPEPYCGTDVIRNIVTRYQVPYTENMKNYGDIYWDALCLEIGNMVYGEWGLRALRAAAMGMIVFTHSLLGQRIYKEQYGYCGLWIVNDLRDFKDCWQRLMNMTEEEVLEEHHRIRGWVLNRHSLPVMGMLLRQKYEEIL